MKKQKNKETFKCPKCKSEKINDYTEFGLPGGYRFMCSKCKYLWEKL